jgi:hypothetical protein
MNMIIIIIVIIILIGVLSIDIIGGDGTIIIGMAMGGLQDQVMMENPDLPMEVEVNLQEENPLAMEVEVSPQVENLQEMAVTHQPMEVGHRTKEARDRRSKMVIDRPDHNR